MHISQRSIFSSFSFSAVLIACAFVLSPRGCLHAAEAEHATVTQARHIYGDIACREETDKTEDVCHRFNEIWSALEGYVAGHDKSPKTPQTEFPIDTYLSGFTKLGDILFLKYSVLDYLAAEGMGRAPSEDDRQETGTFIGPELLYMDPPHVEAAASSPVFTLLGLNYFFSYISRQAFATRPEEDTPPEQQLLHKRYGYNSSGILSFLSSYVSNTYLTTCDDINTFLGIWLPAYERYYGYTQFEGTKYTCREPKAILSGIRYGRLNYCFYDVDLPTKCH